MPKHEPLHHLLRDFDYRVDCDDFLLYELGRLVEDDRASFEDEEFRRVIHEGIRQHIEISLDTRVEIARIMREHGLLSRALTDVENLEATLEEVEGIVRSYAAYLFRRLEECADKDRDVEEEARSWISRWQQGAVPRDEMIKRLEAIGTPAVAPLADTLFEAIDDRTVVETAIEILGAIKSNVSARVLAHVIFEPMLDEDLEMKAYGRLRAMWPLGRHYILYNLRPHTHEDLPYRWFQLLVEMDDHAAVDRILEEITVHADSPESREDLLALVELLRITRDPETESRILELINTPETAPAARQFLEGFVRTYRAPVPPEDSSAWTRSSHFRAINKKYLAAARLFDAGNKVEAMRKLDALLQDEPRYPFALMLKRMI
jgi:hypothetical protein